MRAKRSLLQPDPAAVTKGWDSCPRSAGGVFGLAFLCVMSAVVCALFLEIPNPMAREPNPAEAGRDAKPVPAV